MSNVPAQYLAAPRIQEDELPHRRITHRSEVKSHDRMLTPSIERIRYGVNVEDTAWMVDGNCAGQAHDEWFTTEDGSQPHVKQAKRICNGCPVRTKCLEFGIEHRELGIWGGMNYNERQRIVSYRKSQKPLAN